MLAVAPSTGFVHVRSGASLQQDQILTVTATDRNGEGLSGTIQLAVSIIPNIILVTAICWSIPKLYLVCVDRCRL